MSVPAFIFISTFLICDLHPDTDSQINVKIKVVSGSMYGAVAAEANRAQLCETAEQSIHCVSNFEVNPLSNFLY